MEQQKELFNEDILLKGKHATYAKFLCPTSEKKENKEERRPADVFSRIIDVYMVAIVIGLYRGLISEEDKNSTDQVRIFADAVLREKIGLDFIFQLVMLVDNSQNLTADSKISRAFRNNDSKSNFELFNSYARGGIEWLYDAFSSGNTTRDDYLAKINEIVSDFHKESENLIGNKNL